MRAGIWLSVVRDRLSSFEYQCRPGRRGFSVSLSRVEFLPRTRNAVSRRPSKNSTTDNRTLTTMRKLAIALTLLLVSPLAQAAITGSVVDADGNPLAGVT